MPEVKEENNIDCAICREIIREKNQWLMPARFKAAVPFCVGCQQKIYGWLASIVGYKLAVYFACAFFNAPYLPELLSEAKSLSNGVGAWGGYVKALRKHKYDDRNGKQFGFADGVTDLTAAFGGNAPTLQVDDQMLDAEEYATGKLNQVEFWGIGPENKPYTQADYDIMTEQYNALTVDRPFRSDQTEFAIRKVCVLAAAERRFINDEKFDEAKKVNGMIKNEMESEQLRKKDELPQDTVRIDGIVQAVERAGLHIMDYDELCKELANRAFHPTYPYTRDAADQMLLLIRNATAWNENQPEVARLSDEFAVVDSLGEFEEKSSKEEKRMYRELGLTPLHMGEDKPEK